VTARDDCNMIASGLVTFVAIPILIMTMADFMPFLLVFSITKEASIRLLRMMLIGIGVCLTGFLLIFVGEWVDADHS